MDSESDDENIIVPEEVHSEVDTEDEAQTFSSDEEASDEDRVSDDQETVSEEHGIAPLAAESKQPVSGGLYHAEFSDFPILTFSTAEDPNEPDVDSMGNVSRLDRDDVWLLDSKGPFEPPRKLPRIEESNSPWNVTSEVSDDCIVSTLASLVGPFETVRSSLNRWISSGNQRNFDTVTELVERYQDYEIMNRYGFQLLSSYRIAISDSDGNVLHEYVPISYLRTLESSRPLLGLSIRYAGSPCSPLFVIDKKTLKVFNKLL
ncbi:hypothetical protein RCL1_003026 [Eukaryota sp. TZLM3-RCL]